jgi:hypothetical protein
VSSSQPNGAKHPDGPILAATDIRDGSGHPTTHSPTTHSSPLDLTLVEATAFKGGTVAKVYRRTTGRSLVGFSRHIGTS